MLDAGTALAVMGNHEFNAIAWYARSDLTSIYAADPRITTAQSFLDEAQTLTCIEARRWFLTLPLWLDLPGSRRPRLLASRLHGRDQPHLKPGGD